MSDLRYGLEWTFERDVSSFQSAKEHLLAAIRHLKTDPANKTALTVQYATHSRHNQTRDDFDTTTIYSWTLLQDKQVVGRVETSHFVEHRDPHAPESASAPETFELTLSQVLPIEEGALLCVKIKAYLEGKGALCRWFYGSHEIKDRLMPFIFPLK